MGRLRIVYTALSEIAEADRNPKRHDQAVISESISRFGYAEPMLVDERTGKLVAGHGRRETLLALRDAGSAPPEGISVKDGEWLAPVVRGWTSASDDDAHAFGISINRSSELGGWDVPELADLLDVLPELPPGYATDDLEQMLASLAPPAPLERTADRPTLADQFGVPPFSVLDARQGYWQVRKNQWLALGIQSELGRPRNLLSMSETVLEAQRPKNRSTPGPADPSGNDPQFYYKKQLAEERLGRELTTAEFIADHYDGASAYTEGTSVFDPVLCELAYRWWSPPGGWVLDPFAGGSVRGVVAGMLGRRYLGVELRAEQVEANRAQASAICSSSGPSWVIGDSRTALSSPELAPVDQFDFLFSCPPYFDLEQYSDDPADLSNADDFGSFLDGYDEIVAAACARLADDRFACFVVGNVRGPDGILHDLGAGTVTAFERAGLAFYNDAILVTSVGSLALRARLNFSLRKLGRCHQQVLVFLKGDARRAVETCGPVEAQVPLEEAP